VCLFYIVCGGVPFAGDTVEQVTVAIKNHELVVPDSMSPGLQHLLRGILDKNPETRMTLEQIMTHEWVTQGGTAPLCAADTERAVVLVSAEDVDASISYSEVRGFFTQAAESRTYQPGEYLVRQGDSGNEMFYIESGRVEVVTLKVPTRQSSSKSNGGGENGDDDNDENSSEDDFDASDDIIAAAMMNKVEGLVLSGGFDDDDGGDGRRDASAAAAGTSGGGAGAGCGAGFSGGGTLPGGTNGNTTGNVGGNGGGGKKGGGGGDGGGGSFFSCCCFGGGGGGGGGDDTFSDTGGGGGDDLQLSVQRSAPSVNALIAERGAGDFIGEMSLLSLEPAVRSASVRAIAETRCSVISKVRGGCTYS
jgi:CRP-like cAMP-binding protein